MSPVPGWSCRHRGTSGGPGEPSRLARLSRAGGRWRCLGGWLPTFHQNSSSRCLSFNLFISARIRFLRSWLAGELSSWCLFACEREGLVSCCCNHCLQACGSVRAVAGRRDLWRATCCRAGRRRARRPCGARRRVRQGPVGVPRAGFPHALRCAWARPVSRLSRKPCLGLDGCWSGCSS